VIVKGAERQRRSFKGVDMLVAAIGELVMLTLTTSKQGQRVGIHRHPHDQAGYCTHGRFDPMTNEG
jgi:quercetin dioxygenase-like cupin family protein